MLANETSTDEFDLFLEMGFGTEIEICGHTYSQSEIFKMIDPAAYSEFKKAWLESENKPKLELVK